MRFRDLWKKKLISFVFIIVFFILLAYFGQSYYSIYGFQFSKVEITQFDTTIAQELQRHVVALATKIGSRNHEHFANLNRADEYISGAFKDLGYTVTHEPYPFNDIIFNNILATKDSRLVSTAAAIGTNQEEKLPANSIALAPKRVVIGAHYDTFGRTPGADDNASGIAGMLELARILKPNPNYSYEFVAFCTEEKPFFDTKHMGSEVHAQNALENGQNIILMVNLEMIGIFTNDLFSQTYFPDLVGNLGMPNRGNFLLMNSNILNRKFLLHFEKNYLARSQVPIFGISKKYPMTVYADDKPFRMRGYSTLIVSDTLGKRNKNYHALGDTAEKLNYPFMSNVIEGLANALSQMDVKEHF